MRTISVNFEFRFNLALCSVLNTFSSASLLCIRGLSKLTSRKRSNKSPWGASMEAPGAHKFSGLPGALELGHDKVAVKGAFKTHKHSYVSHHF